MQRPSNPVGSLKNGLMVGLGWNEVVGLRQEVGMSSETSVVLNTIFLGITWVVPLPSNSHHQDYYIFSRKSL